MVIRDPVRGWSLTELLVAIAVFIMIASAVVTGLLSTQRTWTSGVGQAVLTSELRRALDRMGRELAEGRSSQIQRPLANGAWDATITFRVPEDRNGDGSVLDANGAVAEWSDWITYVMGGRNACLRLVTPPAPAPVSTETLASHITNLQFRRQAATPDVVEIQVTVSSLLETGQRIDRTMGTRVKLRN